MSQEQTSREEMMQKRKDFVPKLMELNEKVLFINIAMEVLAESE